MDAGFHSCLGGEVDILFTCNLDKIYVALSRRHWVDLRVSLYQDGSPKRIYFAGKVEEKCTIISPKGLEKYLKIPLT